MDRPIYRRGLDALWIVIWAGYVLAGTLIAPFHGDESTLIYMSRDYSYQFIEGDLGRIAYDPHPERNPDPTAATQQELRLLNGTIPKYAMGLAWHVAGYSVDDLNDQWLWGADWHYNLTNGHIPTDGLLNAARWSSALMMALGVLVMYGIGYHLDGRVAAYAASALYALSPALLLNGRRAMMEGGLMLFTLLAALALIALLQRGRWHWAILLGIAAGMTVASKHTGALALVALFGTGGGYALAESWRGRRLAVRSLAQLAVAGALALMVFYMLNPAWWGDPVSRAQTILSLRTDLLDNQRLYFYNYANAGERLDAYWRNVFIGLPQYYEVNEWRGWIGEQIEAYERSLWGGVGGSALTGLLSAGLVMIALWRAVRARRRAGDPRQKARVVVIAWFAITSALVIAVTPIEWQRYYLPALLPLPAVMSVGMAQCAMWITGAARPTATEAPHPTQAVGS